MKVDITEQTKDLGVTIEGFLQPAGHKMYLNLFLFSTLISTHFAPSVTDSEMEERFSFAMDLMACITHTASFSILFH